MYNDHPMPETVYIETTIPSAYVSRRKDPASLYRRDVTRDWWHRWRQAYDVRCSQAVLAELRGGRYPGRTQAIRLVRSLPLLEITDEILAVAEAYIRHHLMPAAVSGDALHMALASVYEIDYLLTWNIHHLANPNKIDHMTTINRRLGLLTPAVITPEGLWREDQT